MRRLLGTTTAALSSAALVLTMAACTGGDTAEAVEDGGSATLKVWVMGDAGPAFTDLTAAFTEDTGIKLQVDAIPWENVNDKLTTAVASGDGPDVVQIGLSLLPTFADAGVLADLTDVLAEHPALAPSNFPDAVAPENLSTDGVALSVPWVSDTRVLFYRSDILAEAGHDAAPTTWDDMRSVAKELAQRGEGQFGYYIPLWDNTLPVQYTWQAGGDVVDADGAVDFRSPEFAAAADHWLGFFEDGSAPTATDWDQTQGFVSGATPMVVSGPYLAKAIRDAAPELDGSWSVTTLPADQTGTSLFAGSNLGIWKTSKHPDEAAQLLDFLAQPDNQIAWYDAVGELPTSSAALTELAGRGDEQLSVYVDQLDDARTVPMVPGWDLVANEMASALTAIATTGADKQSTLDAFYAKADEIQSNY
ncbi:ABC transporter substrate-binding protein [Cellulomonas sp. Root930]|nr:ABC transporter substrate-binding protein [Cellulomonas sp. Root930]